jgi:diaminohydroxyphosphoribosylaminopyrimidine deaminase / 5-amino-6-(5-phosphoribosylamino)uracil reductase
MSTDLDHMRHAIVLAARGVGRTGRVPSVGCVIVSPDGRVVGRGRTDERGRPHAEVAALAQACEAARGAAAYVTLEPCAHIGTTGGPCADALIAAGIARVVIASVDPDPRTNGQGIARLRAAGIAVDVGVGEVVARPTLDGFFSHIRRKRPHVTLKIAQSLDGRTATATGESKWITSEDARRFGHLLRSRNDAILVGVETAIADDPDLTCRLPGLESHSPIRVVLDSHLRLPATARLAETARRVRTIVVTIVEGGAALGAKGVEIVRVAPDAQGRVDLAAMLTELSARNVTRLLVEGGATVHGAFIDLGLADALEVFTAPVILGDAGRGSVGPLSAATLGDAPAFSRVTVRQVGPDLLESFVRKA